MGPSFPQLTPESVEHRWAVEQPMNQNQRGTRNRRTR
jgi:hypothetical protein